MLRIVSSSVRTISSHLESRAGSRDLRGFSAFSAIQIYKARYDQLRLDPEALRAHLIRNAQNSRRWLEGNPEARRRKHEYCIQWYKSLSSTEKSHRLLRKRLRIWVESYSWVRETLPWKSHMPILHHEPVEHHCGGCHFVRQNRLRIWWVGKDALSSEAHTNPSKEAQYLCHHCYADQRPWSAVMPDGYEHVKTTYELMSRKKQLDGAANEDNLGRDDFIVRRRNIDSWCRTNDWIRELPWPTHQPLLFEQRQGLRCADCLRAERSNRCLWWQSEEGSHICNTCYTKPDWSEIMPRGYEDARSMTDLRARKQQLEELASGHVITSSHAPSSNHRQIGSKVAQATLTRPTSSLPTTRLSPTSRKFSSTSVATISKEYYKKMREDPIRYERYLEANRRYYARLRSGDNKTYRARLEQMAARSLKRHDEDPAFREHAKLRARICHRKFAHRPAYRQRRFLRTLLLDYPWSRAGLPWKSHLPLVSAEPIERHCSGCDTTRTGGVKLWWRKIDAVEAKLESDSQNFLCHHCYIPADDWARAMPEGYEDVKSLKELFARKKQLDGSFAIGKYAKGEYGHRVDMMSSWVRTHEWIRLLDWKTHQPVVSEQKVYDRCAKCDYARHTCLKLWWRSPTETICNACHAKADWSDSMPHGYEDVRTLKELRARKKQLDEEEFRLKSQHSGKELDLRS